MPLDRSMEALDRCLEFVGSADFRSMYGNLRNRPRATETFPRIRRGPKPRAAPFGARALSEADTGSPVYGCPVERATAGSKLTSRS